MREGVTDAFARGRRDQRRGRRSIPASSSNRVLPPNPPVQVDWVILQRFADVDAAVAWLRSERRRGCSPTRSRCWSGADDVHLVRDGAAGRCRRRSPR